MNKTASSKQHKMKTKTFKQEIEFSATPAELYDLIMDQKKHAAFTGAKAKITNRKGGTFDVWDGYITGKNIELVKNKKIVQAWHASDMPEGHISIVTFEFIPLSPKKTLLKFTHANVPVDLSANYESGWYESYWEPMKKYLKG